MALTEQDRAKLSALGVDAERLETETESKAVQADGLEFKEAQTAELEAQPAGDYVSRDEVGDLVKSVAESTNQLVQIVSSLTERIDALESGSLAATKETLEQTPAASLADLYKSVIGSDETRIDGRSKLAKSGPVEAKESAPLAGGLAAVIAKRNLEIERGGMQ